MLKVIAIVAGIILVVTMFIWAIQFYLVIDDLSSCGAEPDPLVAKCSAADAIVAVSGGDTGARTQTAIRLYKEGWASVLVFSGAALDTSGPSNAAVMRKQALASGVPDSAIIVEDKSTDTQQNASRVFALVKDAKRIILVTSPYHQRRASQEFKKVFGNEVTIVNHSAYNDRQWPMLWFLTPDGWWLALSEAVKTGVASL